MSDTLKCHILISNMPYHVRNGVEWVWWLIPIGSGISWHVNWVFWSFCLIQFFFHFPALSVPQVGLSAVGPAADDFLRDVCLTVLRNHKVVLIYTLLLLKQGHVSRAQIAHYSNSIAVWMKWDVKPKWRKFSLYFVFTKVPTIFMRIVRHADSLYRESWWCGV